MIELKITPFGGQVKLWAPKEVKAMKEKILKAVGKRGKTKDELAYKLGVGHSYISRLVNELVDEGALTVVKEKKPATGRPAPVYAAL